MDVKAAKKLTGGDVCAERHRHQPSVTQEELGKEVGYFQPEVSAIERGVHKLVEEEYQRLLDGIGRVVAGRKQGQEAK